MFINKIRNGVIGLLFGRRPFNAPATYYFGISTSDISPDGTGIIEPSVSTGYKRIAIQNSTTNFSEPTEGKVKNLIEIRMNELNTDCGTATHYFLAESETGNAVLFQKLKPADYKPLPANSTLYINVGDAEFAFVNETLQ